MKKLLFSLFVALPLLVGAQKQVRLVCNVLSPANPNESLNLYEFAGFVHKKVASAPRTPEGTYIFTLPAGQARYYGVGFQDEMAACILLGEEPEVKLWASAAFLDQARTVGSPQNTALYAVTRRMEAFYDMPWNEPGVVKARTAYLDSLQKANPSLWKVANVLATPTFNGKDANTEPLYRGNNWFNHVDFSKGTYDNVPYVYHAFRRYATNMFAAVSNEELTKMIEKQLALIPEKSPAYRLALGGLLRGFQQKPAGELLSYFSKVYVEKYRNSDMGEIGVLEFESSKGNSSTPGSIVPELEGMTPDSGYYKLSNLRGKYVLIDFWASWCGPCRRENPNVRALYEKYHDKGFEILGVSLDRDMNSWRKAIADDKLPWKHISDLAGWNSKHAAAYSVTSIPQTVLIDPSGKLVVRNLRGEGLANKLAELFDKK